MFGQICSDFRDLSAPFIRQLSTYLKQEKIDYGDAGARAGIAEIIQIIALMSQSHLETTHESPRND